MNYRAYHDQPLTLRDQLALDRTVLANERTVLAYFRTVILLVVSSVSLLKLFPDNRFAITLGIALLPAAAVVGLTGGYRFVKLMRALRMSGRVS